MQYSICRVSDESGSLEMTPINEMPLKKEHLDPYVSNITPLKIVQSTLSNTDTFGTGTTCPSYKESNKGNKHRQGPTLGVRFTEVSVL